MADDDAQQLPPPKRAKTTGRSFDEEMMALVGECAAAAPVSIAVYCEFNDILHLDSIITRVRPGFIEGRQVSPESVNVEQPILQPMQLLSMDAVEVFLRITRDGALPQTVAVVAYTGARSPPVKFTQPEETLAAFAAIAITGGDIVDNHEGTVSHEEIVSKVAKYVWKLLN